ncbi:MAG TPA: hypothetical protein VF458_06400 [Ktedonobacteraceae bacterium]
MATLTGKVMSQREVTGTYKDGARKGQEWHFLALSIIDEDSGLSWDCQLSENEEGYEEIAGQSLVKHRVSVTVMGQVPNEYKNKKGEMVKQVRSYITDLQDLGIVKPRSVA